MVRFVIQPHSEGGYLIFRDRQLTGAAATLHRAKSIADELAVEERRAGRVGRVVLVDLSGNIV